MGRFVKSLAKRAQEIKAREMCRMCQDFQIERLVQMRVDELSRVHQILDTHLVQNEGNARL